MSRFVAALILLLLPQTAVAEDEFCTHLFDFVRAPFPVEQDKLQHTRSIEFYWMPSGILGTIQCVHEGKAENRKLCDWLMQHTSREFSELLAEDVLRCEGFGFPPVPNVGDWKATYEFVDDKSLRWLVLDVRRAQPNVPYDDAVRISALPDGQDTAVHPLPPFPDPPPISDKPAK